jgi:hypothetical protein
VSDFLLVRGIDATAARGAFEAWKAGRAWARSVELRDGWEPQELEINRRNAVAHLTGKHRAELAELVLMIQDRGGRVIHLMLHRSAAERVEEDLGEWATRHAARG